MVKRRLCARYLPEGGVELFVVGPDGVLGVRVPRDGVLEAAESALVARAREAGVEAYGPVVGLQPPPESVESLRWAHWEQVDALLAEGWEVVGHPCHHWRYGPLLARGRL